ncbi:MAG: PAS domain S-box protein [Caulobacter sp.]
MGGRKAQSGGAGEEARYRAIVDTAVDAIVVIDEHGRIEAFNPAAERLFGYAAADMIGANVNALMPEPHHGAHDGYLETYRATGERRIIGIGREVFGRRQDGSTFPLELSIAEWRSGGRRFFTGVMRDVTERKRTEELQRLLVNELNHRVKNTLATVQSVAGQTLRNAADLGDARESLTTRLLALARTHDILTRESWEGADLRDILAGLIESYGDATRFTLSGPSVRLSPKTALSLSLALHELMTNAAKYGALSTPAGQVAIGWSREGEGYDERLRLGWKESGGPLVSPPERQGFGSRLITRGLALELDGEAMLNYPPDGVACTIVARLRRRPAAGAVSDRGAA